MFTTTYGIVKAWACSFRGGPVGVIPDGGIRVGGIPLGGVLKGGISVGGINKYYQNECVAFQ